MVGTAKTNVLFIYHTFIHLYTQNPFYSTARQEIKKAKSSAGFNISLFSFGKELF